jgi:hypothetical protein
MSTVLTTATLPAPRRGGIAPVACDVFGHVELAGDVPPSHVEKHHGVCALAPLTTVPEISSRWSYIMSVSA